MRPKFLDRPAVWTRTPRTSSNPIDDACALTRYRVTLIARIIRWLFTGKP